MKNILCLVYIFSLLCSVHCCSLLIHSEPWIQNLQITNDTNLLSVDLWHPGPYDDLLHGEEFVQSLIVNINAQDLLDQDVTVFYYRASL
jgi:hypothetical protein